jgi:hypothetical protein
MGMAVGKSIRSTVGGVLLLGALVWGLWAGTAVASGDRQIKVYDDCDPASFNAVIGPGTCVGKGQTTFQAFLAEFQKTGKVQKWFFQHDRVELSADKARQFVVTNLGGEVHTFTRVARFGGGFVPLLNKPGQTVAPECGPGPAPAPAAAATILAPGQTLTAADFARAGQGPMPGTNLYQCCIHPWMQAVVTVQSSGRRD